MKRDDSATTPQHHSAHSSSLSFRHWFGHGARPSSTSSSSRYSTAAAVSSMAAPATASPPSQRQYRSTTSSKLSAFASAFGFGSRSSSKSRRTEGPAPYDPHSDPTQLYSLEHDPFSPKATSFSPPSQFLPLPPRSSPPRSSPPRPSRPDLPRSKSDVGAVPPLPSSSPPASPSDGLPSSSSHGIFHRKRNDSSTKRGNSAAVLPVGNGNAASASDANRGSWHARHRSSIDMQLPQLARCVPLAFPRGPAGLTSVPFLFDSSAVPLVHRTTFPLPSSTPSPMPASSRSRLSPRYRLCLRMRLGTRPHLARMLPHFSINDNGRHPQERLRLPLLRFLLPQCHRQGVRVRIQPARVQRNGPEHRHRRAPIHFGSSYRRSRLLSLYRPRQPSCRNSNNSRDLLLPQRTPKRQGRDCSERPEQLLRLAVRRLLRARVSPCRLCTLGSNVRSAPSCIVPSPA